MNKSSENSSACGTYCQDCHAFQAPVKLVDEVTAFLSIELHGKVEEQDSEEEDYKEKYNTQTDEQLVHKNESKGNFELVQGYIGEIGHIALQ